MTNLAASTQPPIVQAPIALASVEFRELFMTEFEFVTRSLVRLGVREADATDVGQELFLAVLGQLETRDPSRPVRPWLFGFAAKLAANYRRLGWHRGRPLDVEQAAQSPRIGDKLSAKLSVNRALATLAEEQREALILHDLEELTGAEIADALEIPLFTVYSRVRLARAAMRAALQRHEETPEARSS